MKEYEEWIESKSKCIDEYKNNIISLEERAIILTASYANYCKKQYFLYHRYPDIINLTKVYDDNVESNVVVKIIISFQIENESTIDELFNELDILSNVKYHIDKLIFYEFLYKFNRDTFKVDNEILNPDKSYFNSLNIPRFNSIIHHTPLKNIMGTTNYMLSQTLVGLPCSLFLCLNNGSEIYHFGDSMDDLSNIQPKYYKDLNRVFRSSWEANIARILIYNNIDWEYENMHILLQLGGRRDETSTSYIPDFSLVENNFIEVKGFWDRYSLDKVFAFKSRMFAYSTLAKINFNDFIESKLYIIDCDIFHTLDKIYSDLIPNWDKMTGIKKVQELLVVGITRPETRKYVKELKSGDVILFQRDSENKYDKNAVKVLNIDGNMIGFLSKEWACIYAEKIDMGMKFDVKIKTIESKLLRISVQRNNFDEDILYDFLKPKR